MDDAQSTKCFPMKKSPNLKRQKFSKNQEKTKYFNKNSSEINSGSKFGQTNTTRTSVKIFTTT